MPKSFDFLKNLLYNIYVINGHKKIIFINYFLNNYTKDSFSKIQVGSKGCKFESYSAFILKVDSSKGGALDY